MWRRKKSLVIQVSFRLCHVPPKFFLYFLFFLKKVLWFRFPSGSALCLPSLSAAKLSMWPSPKWLICPTKGQQTEGNWFSNTDIKTKLKYKYKYKYKLKYNYKVIDPHQNYLSAPQMVYKFTNCGNLYFKYKTIFNISSIWSPILIDCDCDFSLFFYY